MDEHLLKSYIPIADFIGDVFGSDCEVILYDVRNKENSIFFIKNNSISGRNIGDPMTKTSLKLLEENAFHEKGYITRYPGKTKDGKILRSSTLFIKNQLEEVIGLMTINIHISNLINAANALNRLLTDISGGPERNLAEEVTPISEDFSTSIEDYAMSLIQKYKEFAIETDDINAMLLVA